VRDDLRCGEGGPASASASASAPCPESRFIPAAWPRGCTRRAAGGEVMMIVGRQCGVEAAGSLDGRRQYHIVVIRCMACTAATLACSKVALGCMRYGRVCSRRRMTSPKSSLAQPQLHALVAAPPSSSPKVGPPPRRLPPSSVHLIPVLQQLQVAAVASAIGRPPSAALFHLLARAGLRWLLADAWQLQA
jgi:hypothetical protein